MTGGSLRDEQADRTRDTEWTAYCAPGLGGEDVGAAATLCPTAVQVTFNAVYGLMVVPWCPHEGCGWSMPELSCPVHGNFGMTFLSAHSSRSVLVHVKAVLA